MIKYNNKLIYNHEVIVDIITLIDSNIIITKTMNKHIV